MKAILIAGRAGSGKTYLGEKIVSFAKEKNLRALQTEYSKYIKMYASEILGYDGNRDTKPRKFLQDTGSFIREEIKDSNFFIRRMLEDFRVYEKFYDIVILSDVRLLKEIEEMKKTEYDVTTILVENENLQNNLTEEEKAHITENEFRNYLHYDYVVQNKKKNELEIIAQTIVKKL